MSRRHFMVRRKRDRNHAEIVAALEAVGARIFDLSGVGLGCPDVIALKPNKRDVVLMEIKTGRGALKKSQEQSHLEWPVVVVRTIDEALAAIGIQQQESR